VEFRIKNESGLICDYTNEECDVLIKLSSYHEGEETKWISLGALHKAMGVISGLTASPTAPRVVPQLTSQYAQPIAPVSVKTQPSVGLDERTKIMLESLSSECVDLARADTENKGVPEVQIFTLVDKFRSRFPNRKDMYPVLNHHFGLSRDRFDLLINRPSERIVRNDPE